MDPNSQSSQTLPDTQTQTQPVVQPPQQTVSPSPVPPQIKPKSRKPLVVVFLGLILMLLLGTGIYFKNSLSVQIQLAYDILRNKKTLASSNSVDTSHWKTYTNSIYGYSIKAPSNWLIGGGDSGNVTLQPETDNPGTMNLIFTRKDCTKDKNPIDCAKKAGITEEITITVQSNYQNFPLKEFAANFTQLNSDIDYTPFSANGLQGISTLVENHSAFAFLQHDKTVYVFEATVTDANKSLFYPILSTFKLSQ